MRLVLVDVHLGGVGDCQTFLEDDALQPSPLSKKRKKIAEGLQNNVLEPSRSSKRLRTVANSEQSQWVNGR